MYSNSQTEYRGPSCTMCGQKNQSTYRCWKVIGFPRWHRKYKPPPRDSTLSTKWSHNNSASNRYVHQKQANSAVQTQSSNKEDVMFTPQQLQQLLKLMPKGVESGHNSHNSETDEELEQCFSGMVTCHMSSVDSTAWIIDSGASDHMTSKLDRMTNAQHAPPDLIIKLAGATSRITPYWGYKVEQWTAA